MDPIIQWVGGKKRLLDILDLMLPYSYDTYYEPFLGGGALLYKLLPKNAKIYEININIYNLYINIKNNVKDIIEKLKVYETEYLNCENRKTYYLDKRTHYNSLDYCETTNSIEKTVLLLFLNKTCFNAVYRENKKGQFNVPIGNMKDCTICNTEQLNNVSEYLNNNNINIYNSDFSEFVNTIETNDFVYLDPPYYPLKNDSFVGYDKNSFIKKDHDKLLEILDILNEKNIKFMLSNSNNTYFRDKLAKYNIYDIAIARTLNSNTNDRKECVCEIIVTNYSLNKDCILLINKNIYDKISDKSNEDIVLKIEKKKTKYNLVFDKIIIHEVSKAFYNFITLNNINIKLNNSYTTDKRYFININYSK